MTDFMTDFFSGIAGALLAIFATFLFSKYDSKRSARYLAIRVTCTLDKYVEDCIEVVYDDGLSYGQRPPDGRLAPQVMAPGPPVFPDDIDWKSIDHELMYEILSFPSDVEAGDNAIAFAWDIASPPDFEEVFEERAFRYAGFGLTAYELTKKLRKKYDIPSKDYQDWDPISKLQEELEAIRTRRGKEKDHVRVNDKQRAK